MTRRGNQKPCGVCGRLTGGCCADPEGDSSSDAVQRERRRVVLWLEARAKLSPTPVAEELRALAAKVANADHCNRQ